MPEVLTTKIVLQLGMSKWFLGGILVLAFLLRVPFLNLYPIGFTADEASFGYDAYSLLHTGKDQWGHVMPLMLESFGDFKAPLYSYLDVPFVAILGLTKLATRLPGALLGVGAVFVVYLLVRQLSLRGTVRRTQGKLKRSFIDMEERLPLLAALFLAISPWHIQLSRGAFESNLTSFFLPLGVLLFLKGLNNSKLLIVSSIVFGLNLFSYHSAKVVTPLVVGFLVFLFWKQWWNKKMKRPIFIAAAIFALSIALTGITFFQGAGRRASDVSIFGGALESQASARLSAIDEGMSPIVARLLHNKYFVITDRFFYNYRSYFKPDFLFINGVREGTYGMVPRIAVLYWFELPLLLIFLWYSFKNRKEKYIQLIFFWLLVAPIPAALTQGVGNAGNRAATMLPVLQMASAIGAFVVYQYVSHKTSKRLFTGVLFVSFILILFSFTKFAGRYVASASKHAPSMLYGDLEVAAWLAENAKKYTKVIVSRKLSEPQIFIAFAQKWNPGDYQESTVEWRRYRDESLKFLDQLDGYSIGKYSFGSIYPDDFTRLNALLVGSPDEFPKEANVIKKFIYPDGQDSIWVVKTGGIVYAYE